jgi:ADP-ribose pyrophosphatase
MHVEIKNEDIVYSGFFKIKKIHIKHQRYDGGYNNIIREQIYGGDDAFILAYDSEIKKVLYVNQFRVGALKKETAWSTELIAGLIDEGENPIDAAIREGMEETGLYLKAEDLNLIFSGQPSIGGSTKMSYIYVIDCSLSNVDTSIIYGTDQDEDIKLSLKSFEDVKGRFINNSCDTIQEYCALSHLMIRGLI